ncbi:MAG: sugar phosphate isomerase/epimerase, partial [Thermoplasmata archaeon]|nr:sugar phosphate isomerase/epimerase [Thermoplasmata archaeon]
EYSIDVIMDIVRIANELGIGMVTIHPGKIAPIQSYAKDRVPRYTRQSLELLEKRCREFSVELAFENMPVMRYTICHTAAEMVEMLEGLEMKMCFDVGHAHIAGQMGATDEISKMLDMKYRFANIHLSDNMGDRDRHMALGKGSIDFQKVMYSLSDYQGNHIIETRSLEDGITGKAFLEKMI